MAKDIRIANVNYNDVPALDIPLQSSGTARFYDVQGSQEFNENGTFDVTTLAQAVINVSGSGGGLVLVKEFDPMVFKFSQTDFNGWTPSSTAKAILAAQTVGTFTAADIDDNDYFIRTKAFIDVKYNSGTSTAKGTFQKTAIENWYDYTRRPSTYAMMEAGTLNTNVFETVSNLWVSKYYNTSWTLIYSGAYGIYPSNAAPTSSSTTATSPTVTVKTPIINAKCNSTYFSTTMAGKVDQEASTITFKSYAYRADGGYRRKEIYESIIDLWQNGLE